LTYLYGFYLELVQVFDDGRKDLIHGPAMDEVLALHSEDLQDLEGL